MFLVQEAVDYVGQSTVVNSHAWCIVANGMLGGSREFLCIPTHPRPPVRCVVLRKISSRLPVQTLHKATKIFMATAKFLLAS